MPCGWAGLFSSLLFLSAAVSATILRYTILHYFPIGFPPPPRLFPARLSVCGGGNARKVCTSGHVLNSYSPPRLLSLTLSVVQNQPFALVNYLRRGNVGRCSEEKDICTAVSHSSKRLIKAINVGFDV